METFTLLALVFLVALVASVMFTLSVIELAEKKKLYEANNALKLHSEQVCSLGGIAIFSAFWIAYALGAKEAAFNGLRALFAGSFILFLAGVKDDLIGMPALKRLVIQIGIATLLFFNGVSLDTIPGLGITLHPVASYLISIGLIGAIVNAHNFIDGINGLAGGLTFISGMSFAIIFMIAGEMPQAQLALALAGGVLGFTFFNFGKAKVFMGDNGSTFIGIVLSYLTFALLQPGILQKAASGISPLVVLAILIVPLADLGKVVLVRLINRKSPFLGDRTHIHHVLGDSGLSTKAICGVLYGWNVFVILFSIILLPQNIYIGVTIMLLIAGLPYLLINLAAKYRKEKREAPFKPTRTRELHQA